MLLSLFSDRGKGTGDEPIFAVTFIDSGND